MRANTPFSGFETWLQDYAELFRKVPSFKLTFISVSVRQFAKARRAFEQFVSGSLIPIDPFITRMLGYFRDEDAFQREETKSFNRQKLIHFRKDRQAFADEKSRSLFEVWKVAGNDAVMRELHPKTVTDLLSTNAFEVCLLPFKPW